MIAILYQKPGFQIFSIIPDIISYTDTDVIGKDAAAKGIDTDQAGFVVVEPVVVIEEQENIKVVLEEGGLEYGIGDVLPVSQVVDVWEQLPPTPEQEKDLLIADLKRRLEAAEADNINVMLAVTEVYEMLLGGV